MPKKHRYDIQDLPNVANIEDMPVIQNCVATFSLGVKNINLKALALRLMYCDYNPQRFAAMTMRLKSPKTTALAFGSGNMVCTGSKNIAQCLLACRKYTRILQKAGVKVCFHKFKVQNIVASAAVKHPLKLYEMAKEHGANVSYEPELFPGLVLRISKPKVVFLLFRSGKIVITGAKNMQEINNTYSKVFKHIISHFFDHEDSSRSSAQYKLSVKRKRTMAS
jgi:transcription initiation factor TFIID TATA-box-binding protein|tara:strand:- start:570 stop:1235 length:666 start_codon:yes stop_codon:yes gene_type:complete